MSGTLWQADGQLGTLTRCSTPVLGTFWVDEGESITGCVQFGRKESVFDEHCQTGLSRLPRPALARQKTGDTTSLDCLTYLQGPSPTVFAVGQVPVPGDHYAGTYKVGQLAAPS
jgi:hypothetical protein